MTPVSRISIRQKRRRPWHGHFVRCKVDAKHADLSTVDGGGMHERNAMILRVYVLAACLSLMPGTFASAEEAKAEKKATLWRSEERRVGKECLE